MKNKIPQLAIQNRSLVWFVLVLFIAGGVMSFVRLGKKEDSTFVIKSASIICRYPGATPLEVEQLVTEPIEREVQSMRNVYKITSDSQFGLSKILVELDPATPPAEIVQMWDELRRKVLNIEPQLPSGCSNIIVSDDFGDVYGLYYAISADDGYSFSELREWAQRIKTRVIGVDGVQKISLWGEQQPVVNLYVSLSTLANFAIRPESIISTISRQNSVVSSGDKSAGVMEIKILEDGGYQSLDDIANQLLMASNGKQYRLGDIATVERGYTHPPTSIMRVDGRRAIGIGIATEGSADVVKTGGEISKVLNQIKDDIPLGINVEVLYPEDTIAREATNTFLLNLLESVAIVIVIIMLAMGLRAGFLIGSSLIFSIGGTLLVMQFIGEGLNRTSLAGFIIAMGMLVDNAIVVTDNAQSAIRRGVPRLNAIVDGADGPKWSLLGATMIAIFSFLPLYLAPSAVAEIVKPLFVVLAISLLLSWALALTQTPMFGDFMLVNSTESSDQYDTRFYRSFDSLLGWLLRRRWWVVGVVVVLFVGSLKIMGSMPQNFFPSLDKPYFRADVILPDGHNIIATQQQISQMEGWLTSQREVKKVSTTAGGSPPRYYLASGSTSLMPNFGNILVELHDRAHTQSVEQRFEEYVLDSLPGVWLRSSLFKLSPVPDASIEFGFIGDNIDTLLALTSKAQGVMWQNAGATNIRNSWGNRVPTWSPRYSQMRGQRIGISRSDMVNGLTIATNGYALGSYREGDQFMPILLKDADIDDYNLTNMQTLPIFSPSGRLFAVEQAVSAFEFENQIGVIKRYNRQRVMKAQCDPVRGVNTKRLFAELSDSITSTVSMPNGYQFKVFGEEESQVESNEALAKNFPLTIVLIFVTLLLLFGNYRDPIMILLMIPLIFIGVVTGLAITGKLFNFFALLGVLGLIGMNIKNGVVLVAQINELRGQGVEPYRSVVEATRSRVVPVVVASGTTILGMVPLLFDSLFGAMAATIMGGLLVATLLTICVLPVVYALFYSIKQ
ncbi:MAG: efflux RND transporter permease subunit [Rikenellaceae bacterium]